MSKSELAELEQAARVFRALGSPARLQLLLDLLDCCGEDSFVASDYQQDGGCCGGLNAGALCCASDKAQSTVSFHLKELREAGLVEVERRGRELLYRANLAGVRRLGRLLDRLGGPEVAVPAAAACCVIVKPNEKQEVLR